MALDKLGSKGVQKQGNVTHDKVYDQRTHQIMQDILVEIRLMRHTLNEITGLDIQPRDIEEKR